MLTIISPDRGKKIQIANNDFNEVMNWHQAKKACGELGIGWRLTWKDFRVMTEELYHHNKGNFKCNSYWTGSEANDGYIYEHSFYYNNSESTTKTATCYVRAVRDIK